MYTDIEQNNIPNQNLEIMRLFQNQDSYDLEHILFMYQIFENGQFTSLYLFVGREKVEEPSDIGRHLFFIVDENLGKIQYWEAARGKVCSTSGRITASLQGNELSMLTKGEYKKKHDGYCGNDRDKPLFTVEKIDFAENVELLLLLKTL